MSFELGWCFLFGLYPIISLLEPKLLSNPNQKFKQTSLYNISSNNLTATTTEMHIIIQAKYTVKTLAKNYYVDQISIKILFYCTLHSEWSVWPLFFELPNAFSNLSGHFLPSRFYFYLFIQVSCFFIIIIFSASYRRGCE